MAANWTDFVSGAVLEASQLNGVLDNFKDVAIFREEQASGTQGGTFTSGSYLKRTLNTTVVNNITGCSIASSVITLPAGTFAVTAFAPAQEVNRNKLRLQNTTASTTLQVGNNCYASAADVGSNIATLQTVFTLATSSTIELQHRCQATLATAGFGIACTFSDVEVFASITIQRIA
jgi:hypothetical protein